ncbi:AMP-binding enzyme [Popillia japonica]|uniref:AMP-binding enzyme n=1 Tax=Popillia japonica TaxID=7064 RepID=A0AAW1LXQ8_POPJA
MAWQVVTRQTIVNCFRHGGFIMREGEFDSDDDLPLTEWLERNQQDNTFAQANFNEYVHFDDNLVKVELLSDDCWHEIKRQLVDSEAKILVTISALLPNALKAIAEAKMNVHIITIKTHNADTTPTGAVDWSELTNTKTDIPDVEPTALNDTIFMPYSSGTTGVPKGVELTNSTFVSNMTQLHTPDFKMVEPATGMNSPPL